MAKVVMQSSPGAAYEIAIVQGGTSMSHAERVALLDEYIEQHGLYPVETDYVGETPKHKYGRYKSAEAAPMAASGEDVAALKQQIATLTALLEQSTAPASDPAGAASEEKAKK